MSFVYTATGPDCQQEAVGGGKTGRPTTASYIVQRLLYWMSAWSIFREQWPSGFFNQTLVYQSGHLLILSLQVFFNARKTDDL